MTIISAVGSGARTGRRRLIGRAGCSRRHDQRVRRSGQLAQVVAEGMQGPLALRPLEAAQTEEAGVLTDLHLAEGRLDDGLAPGVVGPALLRLQTPGHALSAGGVLRDPSPGGEHVLVASRATRGDEDVEV